MVRLTGLWLISPLWRIEGGTLGLCSSCKCSYFFLLWTCSDIQPAVVQHPALDPSSLVF